MELVYSTNNYSMKKNSCKHCSMDLNINIVGLNRKKICSITVAKVSTFYVNFCRINDIFWSRFRYYNRALIRYILILDHIITAWSLSALFLLIWYI